MNPPQDGAFLGKVIQLFTGKNLFSKAKHNELVNCINPWMSAELILGNKPGIQIGAKKAVITVPDPRIWASGSATTDLNMHPFKLYATGEVDGSGNLGYQVRSGFVGIRPFFHQVLGLTQPGYGSSFSFGDYSTPFGVDDTDGAPTPDSNSIITPATFFLDPTAEILTSVNHGSYYAFWIEIRPDTDNSGGAWNGAAFINYHRFTIQSAFSAYDGFVFPSLPDANGYEYIPVAIVQVTAATSPPYGLSSVNGLVFQHERNHCLRRFPAGQNGFGGFSYQGDWVISGAVNVGIAGMDSQYRWFYPNDIIRYENLDTPSAADGAYIWLGDPGHSSSPPSNPNATGLKFFQFWQGTF